MNRNQSFRSSVIAAVVVVVGIGVSSAACGERDPLNPCDSLLGPVDLATSTANPGIMDGLWALVLVNGSPIPAQGYKVNNTEYLRAGTLDFRTRRVSNGDCKAPESTTGVVLAQYVTGDGAGGAKPTKVASGTYEHAVSARSVTLKAFDREQVGSTSYTQTTSRLTVVGLHPDNSQLTLVFQR
jgi:hypothetical protein